MSAQECKLENNLCRCCHSEGKFISLVSSDGTMDKAKKLINYAEMLQNCLDIELIPVDGPFSATVYTICELCITRLRDAYSFKEQVIKCEEQFLNMFSKDSVTELKIEVALTNSDEESSLKANIKEKSLDPNARIIEDDEELLSISDTDEEGSIIADIDEDCSIIADIDEDCSIIADIEEDCSLLADIEEESSKVADIKKKIPDRVVGKKKRQYKRKVQPKNKAKKEPKKKTKPTEKRIKKNNKIPRRRLAPSDYEQIDDSLKCTRCDKIFKTFHGLRGHIRSNHVARYLCAHCNQTFTTLAPFIKHKIDEHNIDDRIKCNACDSAFNSTIALINHRNNFHMLGVKRKCPQCDYESFSAENLKKHMFKHKTVKEYHCKYCKKSFLRKTNMQLHERIHTGDRRKVCKECGQAFVQKASLNYHMAKYHPSVKF